MRVLNLTSVDLDRDLLEQLVPRLLGAKPAQSQEGEEGFGGEEQSLLEGVAADHVQGLAQDPTSSHFLEVRKNHLGGV